MKTTCLLSATSALALVAALASCDSSTGTKLDSGTNGGDQSTTCPLQLTAASPQNQSITAKASTDLIVRLMDCRSEPAAGAIAFKIVGNAAGSTLSTSTSSADASGFARVTLTAGAQPTTFQVEASHGSLTPVAFGITVTLEPLGTITVKMTYSGAKVFTEYEAILYPNTACNILNPFALPSGLKQTTASTIAAQPQFTSLAVGTYGVAVTAKVGAEIAGFGCVGNLTVSAGQNTDAPVTITDIPVRYSGTYLLDNQFNLTGALPPSVAGPVTLLTELDDDHDLNNENDIHGSQQYGLDPAAFLLDFILRELCRWECGSGQDFDSCSESNHPKGDLMALYKQNFQSWGQAKPRFWGLCGVLDFPLGNGTYVHYWLQQQMLTMITTVVPGVVINFAQIVSDISAVFTKMRIKSRLSLMDVGPHNKGTFEHTLLTLVVTLHNLSGAKSVTEINLVDVGLTNLSYSGGATTQNDKLQIPTHAFQLPFGKILQYVYLKVLLPALGYTSTAQMFQTWVDCNQVGVWLNQQIGAVLPINPLSPSQLAGFCNTALQAAGAFIENNIQNVTTAKTVFEIQGSCEAGLPLGPERVAQTLVNGAWTGKITEGAFTGPLTGTFTGVRQ